MFLSTWSLEVTSPSDQVIRGDITVFTVFTASTHRGWLETLEAGCIIRGGCIPTPRGRPVSSDTHHPSLYTGSTNEHGINKWTTQAGSTDECVCPFVGSMLTLYFRILYSMSNTGSAQGHHRVNKYTWNKQMDMSWPTLKWSSQKARIHQGPCPDKQEHVSV